MRNDRRTEDGGGPDDPVVTSVILQASFTALLCGRDPRRGGRGCAEGETRRGTGSPRHRQSLRLSSLPLSPTPHGEGRYAPLCLGAVCAPSRHR